MTNNVKTPIRVLIIEDSENDKELVLNELRHGGYNPEYICVETREALNNALNKQSWDIILSDYAMPEFDGLSALRIVKEKGLYIPFILISGTIGEDVAVTAMKSGAQDYIMKGNLKRLIPAVTRELKEAEIRQQVKLSEEKLKESEEKFRSFFENSPIGKSMTNIDGSFKANKAFSEMLGYSLEEFEHKNWKEITHPYDIEEDEKAIESLLNNSEKSIQLEKRYLHKDGTIRFAVANTTLHKNNKEESQFFITTINDITERKQIENALIAEKQTLSNIIEGTNSGTWDWNVQTGEVIINERWAEIIGYTLEELQPVDIITWKNNIYPVDLLMVNASLDRLFKKELDYFDVEFRQLHKDGNWVWVNARGKVVEWTKDGKPLIMSGIHLDITNSKQAEIELIKAKEQAEESDRLKSAFLTNMSHEIRTPMNGILGFTELLKEPNLSSDDQQDYIQTIQISSARMLNTINSIVDISKIESGLMKVDIKETNINEKIEFTYKFFKPEVEIKGLQFLVKNSLPSKEVIIKTDNEKVYAILTNLVRNAIKFTYEGSIEFGYEKKGDYLEFFVKDTGVGIPQNQHKIIFERFRQGSESHNRGYEGSGLGLSIAKTYVEMLGGEIWVESEEGKGSTFYFTIPYNSVSEEKIKMINAVSAEHKEVEIKKLKVLVVEDDEISYSLLTKMLQKISYEVLHAITGVEAVEACRNNPDIDLVLMDIRMPKMDGNEATRQIRQFNTDVIIIAQTAYAFSGDKEKAIEAGCNDYISKPIDQTLLYELIKKHINK